MDFGIGHAHRGIFRDVRGGRHEYLRDRWGVPEYPTGTNLQHHD